MNKKRRSKWLTVVPYLLMLLSILIILAYQIANHAVVITTDGFLHFDRFYDASMQLKTGNFSYFQSNYAFNQSGRVFNALYGPLFSYLMGGLLLLCQNWFNFQLLIDFVVFMIAGIGMYQLALKAKINRWLSLLLALIYMQLSPVNGILRFNFMAWGAALAPFVIMQAVNMVRDRQKPIHCLSLALIMSLLGQVHLLSTIILAATLIPFAIYALVKSSRKGEVVYSCLKAVGLTLILTANVWGGMLLLYHNNKIALPHAFIMRDFAVNVSLTDNLHGRITVLLLLLLLAQLAYVLSHFKESALNTLVSLVAVLIILISSRLFPWGHIQGRFPSLGASFQFPYRLAVGAWPLLLLGVGLTLSQLNARKDSKALRYAEMIILFLTLVQNMVPNMVNNAANVRKFLDPQQVFVIQNFYKVTPDRHKIQAALRGSNDGTLFKLANRSDPDYLPLQKRADDRVYRKEVLDQEKKFKHTVKGDQLRLSWSSPKRQKVILPVVMYAQSQLIVNGHANAVIKKNTISQPVIWTKRGQNQAVLSFAAPWWFWFLLIVTLLSWLVLLAYGISRLVKINGHREKITAQ